MASNVTAQSVLEKISDDHLECHICINRFRQPKVLDCLHSFCLQCLHDLRQSQDPRSTKLRCPLCRKDTILKGSGVADLPNNFTLRSLVEDVTMQEKLLEEIPKCGKHPDQNLNVYCNSCQQVICTTCSVLDHVKHSLTGLPEAVEKCKKSVTEIVQNIEERQIEWSTMIQETCKRRKKLNTALANTQQKISKKAHQEITKIQMEEQKLMKEAERIHNNRIKAFQAAEANSRKEVTQTEHKLEEVTRLMNQASCYKILELEQKLLHNLGELTGKQPEQVSGKLTFMDFEEGERSLGRLILKEEAKAAAPQPPRPGRSLSCVKERWELKREIDNFGLPNSSIKHVAALSTPQPPRPGRSVSCVKEKWELKREIGNFGLLNSSIKHVAALSNNKLLSLSNQYRGKNPDIFIFSLSDSEHDRDPSAIQPKIQISGLNDVSCIAVGKDDKLLVLDGPVVKVFNQQYKLLYQFTPGQGSDSEPSCLAVDDSDLIAVGYEGNDEISLHNPDGSLIGRLPAPMIGDYLTMYNHRLIYTTCNRELVCVDYHGVSVFSADMEEYGYPTGVCCDSDSSIYIAVFLPIGTILHYSPDGKYIGCVIEDFVRPYDITFTSGGDLALAAVNSVQIYHRA